MNIEKLIFLLSLSILLTFTFASDRHSCCCYYYYYYVNTLQRGIQMDRLVWLRNLSHNAQIQLARPSSSPTWNQNKQKRAELLHLLTTVAEIATASTTTITTQSHRAARSIEERARKCPSRQPLMCFQKSPHSKWWSQTGRHRATGYVNTLRMLANTLVEGLQNVASGERRSSQLPCASMVHLKPLGTLSVSK